jgi:hypothetical protein
MYAYIIGEEVVQEYLAELEEEQEVWKTSNK